MLGASILSAYSFQAHDQSVNFHRIKKLPTIRSVEFFGAANGLLVILRRFQIQHFYRCDE